MEGGCQEDGIPQGSPTVLPAEKLGTQVTLLTPLAPHLNQVLPYQGASL